MKLIYIAGRFTAETHEAIEQNILAAEKAETEIIERGGMRFACLVPHSLGRNFKSGPGDYRYWIEATAEMLWRCDAVLMLPGWEASNGSRGELEHAANIGIPVVFSVDELFSLEIQKLVRAPARAAVLGTPTPLELEQGAPYWGHTSEPVELAH
jgi:hypothetical protein